MRVGTMIVSINESERKETRDRKRTWVVRFFAPVGRSGFVLLFGVKK